MTMTGRWAWAVLLLPLAAGCSEEASTSVKSTMSSPTGAKSTLYETKSADPAGGDAARVAGPAPAVPRKIVYTCDISLTVGDFAKAEAEVERLVRQFGGYLSGSYVSGTPGLDRSGRWTARVPVERYEAFLEAVARLGELQHRSTNSRDVTDEFYDLEARLKNKKVEETRLLKHLQDSTGKLSEILEVEKELSRVREEIERQQGRLQLLGNLSEMTTVTVALTERGPYQPATAPGFGAKVSRRFSASVRALRSFGEGLAIEAISVIPWLPVWAVVLGVAWLFWKKTRARRAGRPAPSPRAAGVETTGGAA